eukprot:TRINITY_DN15094_c0_g1_i1.p1 TRINITY_DN15094_c0_g1~~TRINITY_DN15094_c0_g1_i1.p1  ORF type:complete len:250 (-),score=59.68 TRINITY_DN15094_c0_g1_i1:55-804(-)
MGDKILFYCSWFCPYAQRVWMCLEYKGLSYEYIEIDPYKPNQGSQATKISKTIQEKSEEFPDFVKVSPLGLVPALNDHGHGICDSLVCLEYLDEAYPQHPILPKDPVSRARSRFLVNFANEKLISYFYKVLLCQDPREQETLKATLLSNLTQFQGFLPPEGPFLQGSQFSYLDIALLPWWQRLYVLEHYRAFRVPRESHQRLHSWYQACTQLEAFKKTIADTEKLLQTYWGYANNTATSDVATKLRPQN